MYVLECVSLPPANKKLSDITAELSKAQEHARRFQELLMTERRKEKSLKVNIFQYHSSYYYTKCLSIHSMLWSRS